MPIQEARRTMTAGLRGGEKSYKSRKCLGPRRKHSLSSCVADITVMCWTKWWRVHTDGSSPEPAAPILCQELHSESELIVKPFACNCNVQFWFSLTGNHNNSGRTTTIIIIIIIKKLLLLQFRFHVGALSSKLKKNQYLSKVNRRKW